MNKNTKIQRQKLADAATVASKNQKSEANNRGAQKAFGAAPLLDRDVKDGDFASGLTAINDDTRPILRARIKEMLKSKEYLVDPTYLKAVQLSKEATTLHQQSIR